MGSWQHLQGRGGSLQGVGSERWMAGVDGDFSPSLPEQELLQEMAGSQTGLGGVCGQTVNSDTHGFLRSQPCPG